MSDLHRESSEEREVATLLAEFRSATDESEHPDEAAAARYEARHLAAIERQIRRSPVVQLQRHRRVRVGTWLGSGLAVAAALVLYLSFSQSTRNPASSQEPAGSLTEIAGSGYVDLSRASEHRRAASGDALQEADRLTLSDDTSARTTLRDGTTVHLSDRAQLELTHLEQAKSTVTLDHGQAKFVVTKLPVGGGFDVVTPHARVSVVGTRFTVISEVERSCVAVEEGRVRVSAVGGSSSSSAATLAPGQAWSSTGEPCLGGDSNVRWVGNEASVERTDGDAGAVEPEASKHGPLGGTEPGAKGPDAGPPSTLAQQNGLLTEAVRARKRGDNARARQLLQRLLNRYPNSPLRAAAQEELTRLDGGSTDRGSPVSRP